MPLHWPAAIAHWTAAAAFTTAHFAALARTELFVLGGFFATSSTTAFLMLSAVEILVTHHGHPMYARARMSPLPSPSSRPLNARRANVFFLKKTQRRELMIARLVAFLVVVLPLVPSRRRTVLIVMSWNDGRGGTPQFISFFQNTHSERRPFGCST
jgi:hypothetical protein